NIPGSPLIAGSIRLHPTPEHPEGQKFPGLHTEIIDPDRWGRIQEIRRGRTGKGRRPDGNHAFTGGILRCPECLSALRARTTPNGYAYYECVGQPGRRQNCPQSSINARVVEGLILEGLLGLVFDPEETRARI